MNVNAFEELETIGIALNKTMQFILKLYSGLILGLLPANERRRYFITTSPIGFMQALNQP